MKRQNFVSLTLLLVKETSEGNRFVLLCVSAQCAPPTGEMETGYRKKKEEGEIGARTYNRRLLFSILVSEKKEGRIENKSLFLFFFLLYSLFV